MVPIAPESNTSSRTSLSVRSRTPQDIEEAARLELGQRLGADHAAVGDHAHAADIEAPGAAGRRWGSRSSRRQCCRATSTSTPAARRRAAQRLPARRPRSTGWWRPRTQSMAE
jgi:hypothetical protein